MATEKEEAAAARETARRKLAGSVGKGKAGPPASLKGPLPHPRSDPGLAAAKAARTVAAARLRGSMGKGPGRASTGNTIVKPAKAAETVAKPSGQATGGSSNKPVISPAKEIAASTPRPTSGRPGHRKGSIGEASNRDLPGRTTIKYADKPKRDPAALRAASKARFEEQKKIGASRLGAAARSRAMNRNK